MFGKFLVFKFAELCYISCLYDFFWVLTNWCLKIYAHDMMNNGNDMYVKRKVTSSVAVFSD